MEANDNDDAFWLALNRVKGLGPVNQRRLIEAFPSIREIFSADDSVLRDLGIKQQSINSIRQPDWKNIETDLTWLQQPYHYLVTINSANYPGLLKQISDPPIVLFADGQLDILANMQIGIVGSRNPDIFGKKIASQFAEELVHSGAVITSGLALGIDACSHQGALDAKGKTIAVIGNGLDIIYPARHKNLAEKIADTGILISEFPLGSKPISANFPRRNRIISGMSMGILVVQATLRSGSLITARYAIEQGRDVFAVPGSINNPLSRGCHALIKQGAKLVESVNDIIEEIGMLAMACVNENNAADQDNEYKENLDAKCKLLLDTMSYDGLSIDRLVELTGLTIESVSSMLLILELHGLVVSQAGGVYTRAR